jgi:hypothetical protein
MKSPHARRCACCLRSTGHARERRAEGAALKLLADRYGYRTTDDDAEQPDLDPEELAVEVDRCIAYPDPLV